MGNFFRIDFDDYRNLNGQIFRVKIHLDIRDVTDPNTPESNISTHIQVPLPCPRNKGHTWADPKKFAGTKNQNADKNKGYSPQHEDTDKGWD
jgi:hypothetical protein